MAESNVDRLAGSLLAGQARYREREEKERRRDRRRERLRNIATIGGKYIYDKINTRLANKTASFLNSEDVLQEIVHHKNATESLVADTNHASKFAEFGGKINYFAETQGRQRAIKDLEYHLSESGQSRDEAQMAHYEPWINKQSKIIGQELATAYDARMAIGSKLKDAANYEASVKLNTRTSKTLPGLLLNRLKGLSREELQKESIEAIQNLPQTVYAKKFNELVKNAYRNTGDLKWSFETAKTSLPQALANEYERKKEEIILEDGIFAKKTYVSTYDVTSRNPEEPINVTVTTSPMIEGDPTFSVTDLMTPEGKEKYKTSLMTRYLKAGNPNNLAVNNLTIPMQEEYFKRLRNHALVPKGVMDTPEKIRVGHEIVADLMARPNSLIDKRRSTALNNLFAMYVGAMPNFKKERLFRDVSVNGVSAMEKEFSAFQALADKLHTLPANAVVESTNPVVKDSKKNVETFEEFKKGALLELDQFKKDNPTATIRTPTDDEMLKEYENYLQGLKQ